MDVAGKINPLHHKGFAVGDLDSLFQESDMGVYTINTDFNSVVNSPTNYGVLVVFAGLFGWVIHVFASITEKAIKYRVRSDSGWGGWADV